MGRWRRFGRQESSGSGTIFRKIQRARWIAIPEKYA
jgi:hypothetical protein